MSEKQIPTRSQVAAKANEEMQQSDMQQADPENPFSAPPKVFLGNGGRKITNLAGRYRVREGYTVAHGALDDHGRHTLSKGGEIVDLNHDEALSVLRLTKDQRDSNGMPYGPAIENEETYMARIDAQRKRDEFMKTLGEINNFPLGM